MPQLIDENKQIPGGAFFYEPATKWRSRPWASINEIANSLMAHRLGNPAIGEKTHWNTEITAIKEEVKFFVAKHCEAMGWNDYITAGGGQPSPPSQGRANLLGQLPGVAAGAKILVEWIASGEEAVPIDVSESRAAICADCPKNEKGDWTRFFTVPVSNEIKKQLEKRRGWNLKTSRDADLHICSACLCPLQLKIFVGIDRILSRIPDDAISNLDKRCWILSERNSKGKGLQDSQSVEVKK